MKKYNLIWLWGGKYRQHIVEGTAPFLKHKQKQLESSGNWKAGKFIIISSEGLKYQLNKTK